MVEERINLFMHHKIAIQALIFHVSGKHKTIHLHKDKELLKKYEC